MYHEHVHQVFQYVDRRLGRRWAEEVTAQTFAVAWQRRRDFDPDRGSPSAWLYGIAANLIRHHGRAETRQLRAFAASGADPTSVMDDAGRVADQLDAANEWPSVAAALADLRLEEREIITLYCWEGLSYQEIAQALDLPVGTVRSRLSRARARLSAAVGHCSDSEGA